MFAFCLKLTIIRQSVLSCFSFSLMARDFHGILKSEKLLGHSIVLKIIEKNHTPFKPPVQVFLLSGTVRPSSQSYSDSISYPRKSTLISSPRHPPPALDNFQLCAFYLQICLF
jgi:hypothetical protein